MNALYRFALQHRTIARRMEPMIIKDIEDNMRRLAALETRSIRAIAEQIEPVSDGRRLDGRKGNLAVARTYKVES